MSITDAHVTIICDFCFHEQEIDLPFVYPDYSGRNGRYDHDARGVAKRAANDGWVAVGEKHYCESCVESGVVTELREEAATP